MQVHPQPGMALFNAGLALFMLAVCPATSAAAKMQSSPQDAQEAKPPKVVESLLNFDSSTLPDGLQAQGASFKLVDTPGEKKGGALKIVFPADTHLPVVSFRPEKPWDWSDQSDIHIAFDAQNTGSQSIQLYFSVSDAKKNVSGEGSVIGRPDTSSNRSVNIAAGESGTYYAVLDAPSLKVDAGMIETPASWDSANEMAIWRYGNNDPNLKRVSEIGFFVRGAIKEKEVLIDNIRLRRNPEYNPAFMENFVDEFGQNAKQDYPVKIHSQAELEKAANAELASLAAAEPLPGRSRFGGWKSGPQRKATGFFRTEKVDGKWWMVDPEGYLFFSHGLANVRMANSTTLTGVDFRDPSVRRVDPNNVTPEDSIGIVNVADKARKTRYIASSLRNNMFTWLPGYDDDLAEHYSYRRSVLKGPLKHGETFSFYRANLERRYGEHAPLSYIRKWEEVTLSRMLDWGFTSMGNWVDPAFYPNERVPYFANGWIIGDFKTLSSKFDIWAPMPDPFDPEFVNRAKITIDVIADEIKASPWCVGVFVDNEKSWGFPEGTVEHRYGLILDALSRAATDSPAKRAFAELMRDQYGTIDALNKRWDTRLASWEVLDSGVALAEFTPALEEDLSAMLGLLSNEYFRIVHDTVEKVLPNHLYMGVRMASWGMPEETVKAAVKYSDVLSFNIYDEGLEPQTWSFLNEIDLPTIIGEFHIGATRQTGLYHPGLVSADGQADRAKMYQDYMESVLAHNTMVGAHWFQYLDSPITGRAFDGENYNVGFVAVTDIPYPEMVAAAKEFNSSLYTKRYGDKR